MLTWIALLALFLFSGAPDLSFVLAAALIGAGFGMIFSIVSYSVNRNRRDFTSTMQVISSSYSVIVDPDSINRARNILGVEPPVHGLPPRALPDDEQHPGAAPTL